MTDKSKIEKYNSIRDPGINSIVCHAPFISMNFEQNGNVSACCLNREHSIGIFPDDSLKEMWTGKKAGRIRSVIRKNSLPATCGQCRFDLFHTENHASMYSLHYDRLAEATYPEQFGESSTMPRLMEFELSNTCNLECVMCNGHFSSAIRKNREKLSPMSSPYDRDFIKQLKPFIPFLKKVNFLGGEPFLIPVYYQIWALIGKLNPDLQVSITTNGTLVTRKIKKALSGLNVSLIVSIDSLDKETYDTIRINANFHKVISNLKYFLKYTKQKNTDLTIAVCPMQMNWKQIPDILSFCNDRDIHIFFNTITAPEYVTLRSLENDKLAEVIDYLDSVQLVEGSSVVNSNNAVYQALIRQLQTYGDFINADSVNTYRFFRKLLHDRFQISHDIALATDLILKRLANHKNMAPLKYDSHTFEISPCYWDFPEKFFSLKAISKSLKAVTEASENGNSVQGVFNIFKIVFSIVAFAENQAPDATLLKKTERLGNLIDRHPSKKQLLKMLIETDVVFSLDIIKNYETETVLFMIDEYYSHVDDK